MPRRRSSSRSRSSGPRVRKDWVYTDGAYGGPTELWTLNAGLAGALAFPLTLSQNSRKLDQAGPLGAAAPAAERVSWAGIPEGGQQRVYAVDGQVLISAGTWNVGSALQLGWRLKVFEQDPFDNTALTAPFYSMFVDNLPAGVSVATTANEGFLREGFMNLANIAGTVVTTTSAWVLRIRWRSKTGIRLANNNALFLYLESAAGSITVRGNNRMRVLMASAS